METHSSHHTQWEASATDYRMSSLQTFTPQEQAALRTASILTEYPVSNSSNTRKSETRGKTHICHVPGCNKVYKDVSRLRAHLVWHSGKRPFVCDWQSCGKTFYRSDELQRHRRTHTREKRFQCNECDKTFIRRDHLSQHLRGHQHRKNFARQSEF